MNPLAKELNEKLIESAPYVFEMLSEVGKNLYFPKGILSQSAEAGEKAHKFNATIGIATEKGDTMYLPSVMAMVKGLTPKETLTYAPSYGIKPLRETWKDSIYEKNASLKDKKISLPVVTNAITHALSVVADAWVDPGDVVITPDMMWGNYNMIFTVRRGANFVNYPLFNDSGSFNIIGFKECVTAEAEKNKKIIVLLNFPNNPTGYSITSEEGRQIADILAGIAANGTNVIALADDAYFGLFFEDDILNESIFSLLVDRDSRLLPIKLDGATKEYYVWGLRVGFITYGVTINNGLDQVFDALERKTAGAVRGSISNASHLSQSMMLKSLKSNAYITEKEEKYQVMKGRATEVKQVLSDPKYSSAWEPYPFNAGYFMCIRLKDVEAEPLRVHLLDKYGVGLISLGKYDLRVAFSCLEEKDVRELFDILLQGVEDLRK